MLVSDSNVLETQIEVQTYDLTPIECMLSVFLKSILGLLWIFFCIFIKGLVTLFYIGGTRTRDVLTQIAHGRF